MRYPVAIVVAAASLSAAFVNLAAAADIPSQPAPYRAPVAVAVPAFSWTGFYIGAHGGGGWATDKVTNVTGTVEFPAGFVNATNKPSGFLAGAYAGFNYQLSQWLVVGLDGDGSWTNISGNSINPSLAVPAATANTVTRINWLLTASGRVGVAVDNWLFFAKGGGAFAEFETKSAVVNAGVPISNITSTDTRIGWMAGAGIEWAFTPNWLVKAEYNYIDFSANNHTATSTLVAPPNTAIPFTRNATTILNVAKAGLAYKF
jgi:outer membrane immunogenic protein